MPEPSRLQWTKRVEWLILAVGIGLRLFRYLNGRPLWYDEAYIALNVLERSPLGLVQPLDRSQISPVGFLWGEWLATRLGGPRNIRPDWLDAEGRRILEKPAADLVLLIGNNPEVLKALPVWLEAAGTKRVSRRDLNNLVALTYHISIESGRSR